MDVWIHGTFFRIYSYLYKVLFFYRQSLSDQLCKELRTSYQYVIIVVILGVVAHDVVGGFFAFSASKE